MSISTQHYGETRSGRAIYTYFVADRKVIEREVAMFTVADSFDAHALFEHLIRREIRKYGSETLQLERFRLHSDVHVARMTPIERQREMGALSLITIIAVVEYGKCRADHIFVD